jgi:acyl dehydratase
MREFGSVAEIEGAAGEEVGVSPWLEITQDRIDMFAAATKDHQWIHVDPQRAATGPFGSTIAHGYLTLSLLPWFAATTFVLRTRGPRLNYGVNKVRFPSPVPVGSRVRARITFGDVTVVSAGHQLTVQWVVELEGADKPACVAETVVLLLE